MFVNVNSYQDDIFLINYNNAKRSHLFDLFVVNTGYTGSQSHEGNGIDRIFEVNETAQMSSHVSNDSSTNADRADRDDKARVTIGNAWSRGQFNDILKFFYTVFSPWYIPNFVIDSRTIMRY